MLNECALLMVEKAAIRIYGEAMVVVRSREGIGVDFRRRRTSLWKPRRRASARLCRQCAPTACGVAISVRFHSPNTTLLCSSAVCSASSKAVLKHQHAHVYQNLPCSASLCTQRQVRRTNIGYAHRCIRLAALMSGWVQPPAVCLSVILDLAY